MTERVRVLHFVEAAGGGVLSVILDSIREINREYPADFEFTVLYSDRGETPSDIESGNPDIHFARMEVGRRLFSFQDIATIRRVALLSKQYDVMHCHSSRAGFIGRLSRLVGGCRRIFYSPHCYAFISGEFSALKRLCIRFVEMALARVPGTVTVACGDSEQRLANGVGGRVVLVRNGCRDIARAARPGDPGVRVVGSGRDCLQKDPALFLDVSRRMDDMAAQFTWVGALDRCAIATGWLPRDQAVDMIASADVFLMTSRWEGLPVAGLEAMAMGLPLVVRDVHGARDLVEHGRTGYLFSTAEQAAAYVRWLVEDEALRRAFGAGSRHRYEALFTSGNYLALAGLYRREAHACMS